MSRDVGARWGGALRYAHLQPGNFTAEERAFVDVQLAEAMGLSVAGRVG